MYNEYLEDIRFQGRRYFTSEDIRKELNITDDAAKSGLYRLKKSGKIISPVQGLYVIVPPEHRPYGSIPAEELVPIIMKHLNAKYYVALLSAAAYFGATHQKPARFQVISNQRIKHSLKFGKVIIELVYKKSLEGLPTQNFNMSTGYLTVATPELIAIDLFKYSNKSGGISHISTVLSELVENLDADKLFSLAVDINEICQIQRIGYVFDKLEVMDEEMRHILVNKLNGLLNESKRPFVALVPSLPKSGCTKCEKWKILENSDFESDL